MPGATEALHPVASAGNRASVMADGPVSAGHA